MSGEETPKRQATRRANAAIDNIYSKIFRGVSPTKLTHPASSMGTLRSVFDKTCTNSTLSLSLLYYELLVQV